MRIVCNCGYEAEIIHSTKTCNKQVCYVNEESISIDFHTDDGIVMTCPRCNTITYLIKKA